MGLFGGTKVYVSSVVYNLAGDIESRPNFLKTTVISSVLNSKNTDIASTLSRAYRGGQGIKLRNFYRWAQDNYDLIGVPRATFESNIEINPLLLAPQIPVPPGTKAVIQFVQAGPPDFIFWAQKWILDNDPSRFNTAWFADLDQATNKIIITFPDDVVVEIDVTFNPRNRYICALYTIDYGTDEGELVPGTQITLPTGDALPSVEGWSQQTSSSVSVAELLARKVITTVSYSDARPSEVSEVITNTTSTNNREERVFKRTTYNGEDPTPGIDRLLSTDEYMYTWQDWVISENVGTTSSNETIAGGVTKTTSIETRQQVLTIRRRYRIDTQERVVYEWSDGKVFIYALGDGNTVLDQLAQEAVLNDLADGYLPYIPIRINNQFLSDTYQPQAYALAKTAFKKSMNGDFDDIVEKLADNEKLGDIDYAYVVFGCALNTKNKASLKYLYNFFNTIRTKQQLDYGAYVRYTFNDSEAETLLTQISDWRLRQNPNSPGFGVNQPYEDPPEDFDGRWGRPVNSVAIRTETVLVPANLNISISWSLIERVRGTGLLKPDAKPGDYWFEKTVDASTVIQVLFQGRPANIGSLPKNTVALCWQQTPTRWSKLVFIDMVHQNSIYGGKFVEILATEALDDAEESGFIVPLHYETLRKMSLVDSTEIANQSSHLLLNSYLEVKLKWYETGIFKIIILIVIIALVIIFPPSATGAGIIGTNIAVGTALGLTGAAAVIAGFVANALAAMILIKIVQAGATALFGDKIGLIIGTIASVVALTSMTAFSNGTSVSDALSSLLQADKLVMLTAAIGNDISQIVMNKALGIAAESAKLIKDYNEESRTLAELYAKNLGYDNGLFDPMSLISSPSMVMESSDAFLSRTLMTGSDIAEASMSMISEYASIGLDLKLKM